jgi:hypothetical protein
MEDQTVVVISILGGYGALNLWILSKQIKNSEEIAVLKALIKDLSSDVKLFLKTETDVLKELIQRTTK